MIEVKQSRISGRGVFATRDIQKGEVVVPWHNTRELTRDEYRTLPPDELQYIDISGNKILLVGEPERYVNHSCDANTLPGKDCDIAARDIALGSEITANYALFQNPHLRFQCNCGAVGCHGLIR